MQAAEQKWLRCIRRDPDPQARKRRCRGRPASVTLGRAPRSTMTATATTSAPASWSASTAVNTEPPVVEVSSTASTRRPATSGAFDPALESVRLALLADDERIKLAAPLRRNVHHRRRHWISAEREPTTAS